MRKILFLIIFFCTIQLSAESTRKYKLPNECVYAENYKSFLLNRTGRAEDLIETELFGKPVYDNRILVINRSDGGIHFDYYFYKVNDENLCLGITAYNGLQDDAVVYVNTQNDCGTKCKVYLSKPDEKQIFYLWEPDKEIITDNHKEKLTIKTSDKTYYLYLRTGIKELELIVNGSPKIKTIDGLEKFPYLQNLSLAGFDY